MPGIQHNSMFVADSQRHLLHTFPPNLRQAIVFWGNSKYYHVQCSTLSYLNTSLTTTYHLLIVDISNDTGM